MREDAQQSRAGGPGISLDTGGFKVNINEYLRSQKRLVVHKGYAYRQITKKAKCADGFTMSVQVSSGHYCSPRIDDAKTYESVEVGYPSTAEELLMPYADESDRPTDTIYPYVPVEVVDAVIEKHGGLV